MNRSRSWLYYQRTIKTVRGWKRLDVEKAIGEVIQECPATYGFRRIHALLLRQGIRLSRLTVWRIMVRRGWLSSVRTKKNRPGRLHQGQVATLIPNQRWASDITGIKTWDGERWKLGVIIDCADRVILSWRFAPKIKSEDLCEMIREAIFYRFGEERNKAKGIEMLSDNGPEYASRLFRTFLESLGLIPCHTPCRSPESNGVAEAFFGSFKRDYVYQNCIETIEGVQSQIPDWIAHYNQIAPHSSLKMKSPVQFYKDWLANFA